MEKVGNMHKHMRSLGREREAINKQKLTENARTVLGKKNMISERKHSFDDIVSWTQERKVNLVMGEKSPN